MNRRFAWILPLLLGAGIASLLWWLPSRTSHASSGSGLTNLEIQGEGSAIGPEDSQAIQETKPKDRTSAAAPKADPQRENSGSRGVVPDDSARLRVQLSDASPRTPMAGIRVVAYLENPPPGVVASAQSTDQMRGDLTWSPTSNVGGMVEFDLPPDQDVRISVRPDPNTHQP